MRQRVRIARRGTWEGLRLTSAWGTVCPAVRGSAAAVRDGSPRGTLPSHWCHRPDPPQGCAGLDNRPIRPIRPTPHAGRSLVVRRVIPGDVGGYQALAVVT